MKSYDDIIQNLTKELKDHQSENRSIIQKYEDLKEQNSQLLKDLLQNKEKVFSYHLRITFMSVFRRCWIFNRLCVMQNQKMKTLKHLTCIPTVISTR